MLLLVISWEYTKKPNDDAMISVTIDDILIEEAQISKKMTTIFRKNPKVGGTPPILHIFTVILVKYFFMEYCRKRLSMFNFMK